MKKVDVVEIFGIEVYASLSSTISNNAEIDCFGHTGDRRRFHHH